MNQTCDRNELSTLINDCEREFLRWPPGSTEALRAAQKLLMCVAYQRLDDITKPDVAAPEKPVKRVVQRKQAALRKSLLFFKRRKGMTAIGQTIIDAFIERGCRTLQECAKLTVAHPDNISRMLKGKPTRVDTLAKIWVRLEGAKSLNEAHITTFDGFVSRIAAEVTKPIPTVGQGGSGRDYTRQYMPLAAAAKA